MLIDDVSVADRSRTNLGDLSSLMSSIEEFGLLQPIGVTEGGDLVFGQRRLEAMRRLGFSTVPVRVISTISDALSSLRAERDENAERLPFSPVEAISLRRRIRLLRAPERDAALRERVEAQRSAGGRFGPAPVSVAPVLVAPDPSVATVDDEVSRFTGFSTATLKRVERVAELAASEDESVAEPAREALARIEAGEPIRPTHDALVAEVFPKPTPMPPAEPEPEVEAEPESEDLVVTDFEAGAVPSPPAVVVPELAVEPAAPTEDPLLVSEVERLFFLRAALDAALQRWERDGGHDITRLLAGLPSLAEESAWLATADGLAAAADVIRSALAGSD